MCPRLSTKDIKFLFTHWAKKIFFMDIFTGSFHKVAEWKGSEKVCSKVIKASITFKARENEAMMASKEM